MRPGFILLLVLLAAAVGEGLLAKQLSSRRAEFALNLLEAGRTAGGLGLSGLAVSTEARYTRHAAVSDRLVPFMDHPGALEHFPSGSFYSPAR